MTAKEVINQVTDLPMISETARKLVTLLAESDTHRDELVRTIRCDNVLTAKILRVCNSADAGLKHPVASLDQAVLMLGDSVLFRMVSAIGFGADMRRALPGYAIEANGLWSHSLVVGLGAEYISKSETYGSFQPSLAFTAGLLHDIGKLLLTQILTAKNRADIRQKMTVNGLLRVEAERAVLGVDHAEAGACLLEKWRLPEILVEAVAHHHSPIVQPTIHLSGVVYLANCAAHLNSATAPDPHTMRVNKSTAETLGIAVDRIEPTMVEIHDAMKGINRYLAIA
ncbi:MAG TPA: HDOD domain-containing protein [Verrucomicrobiae bacterium]|jgi:putative nucleotidyltransferase with HDIG domain|nr:HDOD domain-containing protein [Verrucomicrobiae bacterium]